MARLTPAQTRFVELLKQEGGAAEYWPLVNDWTKGDTRDRDFSLAFRNQLRTVDALVRAKVIAIDDDGMVKLVADAPEGGR